MPRATRRCPRKDCDNPMPCRIHADTRPSRQERGYDAEYEAALRTPEFLAATHCECGKPFTAENPKTGGHRRDIRKGGTTKDGIFPQCAKCNYGWRRAKKSGNRSVR